MCSPGWRCPPHFVEEQLHAARVDMRQDQRVESVSLDTSTAARLVLEHQLDRSLTGPERAELGESLGESFFHSC